MSIDKNIIKGLMTLAVESSLFNVEHVEFEKITKYLKDNYDCYLPDCLEKPEYLKNALTKLYNGSYDEIINKIKLKLDDFTNHDEIAKFLLGLKRN